MNLSSRNRPYRMTARAAAAAATAERVLASAWRHFSTRPYDEVALRDIAAGADVTVQTLHARFGTKDALLVAAYRWWGDQEGARRDTAPAGDPRAAVRNVFDHYEAHGDAIMRMQSQEERVGAIREATDLGREYHREWVARVFTGMLDGLPRAARERRLARLVVATDVYTWKLLRRDMRMSRARAEQVVVEMVDPQAG